MIPVFRPSYTDEEVQAVKDSFQTGWTGLGPKTQAFEVKFAQYTGTPYAVGTNSCTAALHLALKVIGVEGGEVITPSLTFVSTNHAILYNKAKPVFCDLEEDTLNIDAGRIEELVSPDTKAIVVVHYGGHACEMDTIMNIASKHNLKVVEDCAHACGGEYKGKKLGSIGDIGCFSFHAVKNLACGEGGMITLKDDDMDKRLRKLRWLGIDKDTWKRSETESKYSWSYTVDELGYKYHMNDIQAAIGLVQLAKLERLNEKRRKIVKRYNEAFGNVSWISVPVERPYAKSALHNYVIKVKEDQRDAFMNYLGNRGVSSSVHYFPNHLYEMYKPFYRRLPVTESVWKKVVTLPLYPDLKEEDIQYIIQSVKEFKEE